MRRATLWIVFLSACALAVAGCGGGGHLRVTVTTAPTTLAAGASSNVTATVTHDHAAGGVNWSCAPSGACGTFNPVQTPSGTPSTYTAPDAAPAGGSVTITATSVTKPSVSASVTLAITGVASQNFAFYASGEENNPLIEGADTYSIAGVVAIAEDGSGTVTGGEQDYNDGHGNTSPQPGGDTITGGSLVMFDSVNGLLTLSINNDALPQGGTEVFAVAFANSNHAVITEFDGATSFGSLDLQTTTAMPVSASFAFAANGANVNFDPVAEAGVFAADATGILTGTVDQNDSDTGVTLGIAIPANTQLGPTDAFGRGTVIGSLDGSGAVINYYMVGPEVIRFIDVDLVDTAVGSAYGQGSSSGSFSSGSIGQSVFSIGSAIDFYGAVGQFFTSAAPAAAAPRTKTPVPQGLPACTGVNTCVFNGVGDLNDLLHGDQLTAQPISGTYSIAANGYGSLSFNDGDFDTVATLGVYAVDPTLNILDPNDTTDGTGGALIAEMDTNLVGIGSIVPQTDTAVASFNGSYAFGGQGDTTEGDEFDFVGGATATTGATVVFSGLGALSDPFDALTGSFVQSANATFNATFTPDPVNTAAGRYTAILEVAASNAPPDFPTVDLGVTAYQAYDGQLFCLETDADSYFLGSLEAASTPFGGAQKAHPRASLKKH